MVCECTLQARSVKSRFLRTHKSSTYRYENAILYPRNQSNGSEISTRPGQMSGKQSVSQNFYIRLLYPNTAMRGKKNCLSIFDMVQFQGEEEFERHTRSLRHTLVA